MCGHDWCSVRISKEIQEFASGKDENYAWDKPEVSAALTIEQKEILEQRGVLTPEEVHRLASKMGADKGKATCHSDNTDADAAKTLQNA
jgi:phosphomethylpyrimidine synthase